MKGFGLLFLLITFFSVVTPAQHGRRGHFNPDSLTIVEKSGWVIADTTVYDCRYYLDENNDGTYEFILNFGPRWYRPDSSDAARPVNGQQVTISGGLKEDDGSTVSVIVVYAIDGKFWRDPYDSYWNDMGRFAKNHSSCGGNGFGWMHDSLKAVSAEGIVITDTTFNHSLYFLDSNNDTIPDYFLNLGPDWYKSKTGIERPHEGDTVSVEGWLVNRIDLPVIIVTKINGEAWRDSLLAEHFGSGWFHKNMMASRRFHSMFDDSDFVEVKPGWKMGNKMNMGDSVFCELLEILPGSIPYNTGKNAFAAYEINMYESSGRNGMHRDNNCGGRMIFNSTADVQLHYDDSQLTGDESSVEVKYWDETNMGWKNCENVIINNSKNTVSFSASDINNYYILTSASSSGVETGGGVPEGFELKQNYPNPFNPSTTISFSVPSEADVTISIYDITGKLVTTLINNQQYQQGTYNITWNASPFVSSGIYFIRMDAGSFSNTIKLALIR